jgi:hypothetical protein
MGFGSRGAPSSAEWKHSLDQSVRPMPLAATWSAATARLRSRSRLSTTTPIAATTSCRRRTGTATENAPRDISSSVVAQPSRRTNYRGQVAEYASPCVLGCVGQQDLAHPSGVHRQPRSDAVHRCDGRAARQALEVEHRVTVGDCEVHDCERGCEEVVEERGGCFTETGLHGREQPDVP